MFFAIAYVVFSLLFAATLVPWIVARKRAGLKLRNVFKHRLPGYELGLGRQFASVLPLMKKYNAAAIALLVDEREGVTGAPEHKLAVAERIIAAGARHGLAPSDFVFDAVALGVATVPNSAQITFNTICLLREKLNCNITLGASNAAFGLPGRLQFNAVFLAVAIMHGCNVPITDPMLPELKQALQIAEVLRGTDEYAIEYISAHRARVENVGGSA